MTKPYHILNGDALLDRFPEEISGNRIVMRECLIDGPVSSETDEAFYAMRADFLRGAYDLLDGVDYKRKAQSQIEAIQSIPAGSEVHLWFEDDLFCQANMWFVIHQLRNVSCDLYLVRPAELTRYGFGAYDKEGLEKLYRNKTELTQLTSWQALWYLYAQADYESLSTLAEKLSSGYPQLVDAARTLLLGKAEPLRILKELKEELLSDDFGKLFNLFSERYPIYGYGDLQIERLLAEIN